MKKRQKRLIKHSKLFLRKQKFLKERFLVVFRRLGRQGAACEEAGISHDAVWDWRETDQEFEAAYLKADARIGKLCEDEAVRRAVEGTDKGVYYEGRQIAVEKEYSDTLLSKILAARLRMYRSAEDANQTVVPNVTVINYGSSSPAPANNASPQLHAAAVPTPHIKSYR